MPSIHLALSEQFFFNFVYILGGTREERERKMGSDVPMPDLSHLTEEERQTIMDVIIRQREEEKAETLMYKSGRRAKLQPK